LSIRRTIVFVTGRIAETGREADLFACLRLIFDFLFKLTPIAKGLLSNIRPLEKTCAAALENHVSARVRKRSTHAKLTKMCKKPADLTASGDLGLVLEDVLRHLADKTVSLGGKWQRRPTRSGIISSFSQSRDRTLREHAFQLTQNSVRFAQGQFHDCIGARLRIAIGINAQLGRVARRPDMRNVAIIEIDAHAVEDIDAHDVVEFKRGCEEMG
jgi:hypothetical protein